MATEYGRKSGSYSTSVIGRWELVRQDIAGNYSVIRSHLYFYYGGSTSVGSSSSSFGTMGVTLYSGSYRFYPGETHLGSTDFTVYHNADGTFPATNIGFWAESYHISSGEVWGTIGYRAVPDIPRQANVTGYNDFNDEQNPTITYNNPGGFRINARLEFGGTNIRRDNISNTGSYTFNLTDGERKLLRQKCTGNSMTVRGVIATCIGGTTENYWSYWDRTMTIVNGNPTFNNFEFEDVNEKTTILTGNPQSVIKGYSTILATISTSNKAIAKKEATMSKYRLKIGESSVDIPYNDSLQVGGRLTGPTSSTVNCYAIDSRGNSTLVSKQAINFLDYNILTKGNITIARANGTSESVTLKLNGNFDNINFGEITNSIKSAKYRYKVSDSSNWSDYQELNLKTSVSDRTGSFIYDDLVKGDTSEYGFDINNSYQIEVVIEDELSSITYTANLGSGIPNVALAKTGVGFMGKYDKQVGGLLQVGGKCYDKNLALIYPKTNINVTNEWQTLSLTGSVIVGNKLTINNGKIKIGKGVSKVKVSGTIFFEEANTGSYMWNFIKSSNGGSIASILTSTSYFNTSVISEAIFNVNEGTEIYFYINNAGYASKRTVIRGGQQNTWLLVEVIE